MPGLAARITHVLRVSRTAFGFAVFGLAAPLLGVVVLCAAWLRSSDPADSEIFVQRAVHHACRLYMRFLESIGVLRFVVHGLDPLREPGGQLVVANHPTLIDVLALFASMPQADCIVSQTRAENPFLRTVVRACGYVSNDRGPAIVATCAERLRRGRSLIVFPEGTRSASGALHHFQRGAAHIALAAPCHLLPVAIRCDPPTLAKGQKWYDVPEQTFTLTLSVGEPILTEPVNADGVAGPLAVAGVASPLAARRLTARLREALQKQLDKDLGMDLKDPAKDLGKEPDIGDVGIA